MSRLEAGVPLSQGHNPLQRGNAHFHALWRRHRRHGHSYENPPKTIVYEWCIPLQGPTVYEDYLNRHGEGFHHLGFEVDKMDKVIAEWAKLGFPVSQSGAWGEEGKPGSGRFAYVDTDSIGGVTLELPWDFRE